jgi:hypothetical protein
LELAEKPKDVIVSIPVDRAEHFEAWLQDHSIEVSHSSGRADELRKFCASKELPADGRNS